jgi:hypothetical protein
MRRLMRGKTRHEAAKAEAEQAMVATQGADLGIENIDHVSAS